MVVRLLKLYQCCHENTVALGFYFPFQILHRLKRVVNRNQDGVESARLKFWTINFLVKLRLNI
jgi:hypothetical protein